MKRTLGMRAAALMSGAVFAALIGVGIASAQTEPVISNVSVTPSSTSATITWNTDENANAQVLYGTSTPLTASSTVNPISTSTPSSSVDQSVTLSGLTPDTTYFYSAVSTDASSSMNSSTIGTFTTLASTTASTTGILMADVATGTPGSTVNLTGMGFGDSETVNVDFDGATSSAGTDASGTFTAALAIPSTTVSTDTPVTIDATGVTSDITASTTFTIVPPMSTSTATSTPDLTFLQSEIAQLQNLVNQLMAEVQTLLAGGGGGSGGNGGSYPSSTYAATIDPVAPVRAGTSVDFTGRNWAPNERVTVSLNGATIDAAQADGGGNFSTGSLSVGADASGTWTYSFTGMTSGITRTVGVNITQQ